MRDEQDGLLPVEDAKAKVLDGFKALNAERVSVADAHGRVLAEDLASRLTQPPKPVSAMDGYAVRAEDVATVPATLKMIGESAAGSSFHGNVGAGETVRIFTGAAMPEGADAIVVQEDTDIDHDQITMKESSGAGRYVRPTGLDFQEGQVLLKAGTTLNSRHVALAAGMNIPWVNVARKPRVSLFYRAKPLARIK